MTKNFDAIIIGGGASGLMCAVSAKLKKPNLSVAVIEKNDRVGKKLLATGNGRCNLTNEYVSPSKYVGSFQEQSEYVLAKYNTKALLNFFKRLGLLTFCDSEGRYYPVSKQASSVLDVLRFACDRLDVKIFCGEGIHGVKKNDGIFYVKTQDNEFSGKKLVIACGSKASPKLGGNASGADYLKNFGHTIVPFSPALCPVKVNSPLLKSLKGVRVSATAGLFDSDRLLKTERGEIQFAENALSGICVFNLSLYVKPNHTISLDLLSDISENELFNILQKNRKLFYNLPVDNIFTGIFHKRVAQAVLKMSNISDFSRLCKDLTDKEAEKISHTVKDTRFRVVENSGFEQAQCAVGGVKGNEIDEKTMQSKKCGKLYVCGEAVDLCGECGGYNLHFAFASGITVGENL